ncbi:hypothetical protein ACSNKN_19515 [Proteus mirabilis]
MLQLFARYFSVGVINTLLHWVVFGIFVYLAKNAVNPRPMRAGI